MDYFVNENVQPKSHYEYIVEEKQPFRAAAIKERAFYAMDQLEGWCSKYKASILIDFVLLLKPQTVVEIGVFGGKSLVPLAFAVKENKVGKIYGIDPWSSVQSAVGMEGEHKDYWSTIDHDAILQNLVEKICRFELEEQTLLIRCTSADALPIENIDFLHIDGNHSEKSAYFDVNKWVPLVRKGGLIIFDDLDWDTTSKATEWLDVHCIKLVEYQGDNSWAVWIKL